MFPNPEGCFKIKLAALGVSPSSLEISSKNRGWMTFWPQEIDHENARQKWCPPSSNSDIRSYIQTTLGFFWWWHFPSGLILLIWSLQPSMNDNLRFWIHLKIKSPCRYSLISISSDAVSNHSARRTWIHKNRGTALFCLSSFPGPLERVPWCPLCLPLWGVCTHRSESQPLIVFSSSPASQSVQSKSIWSKSTDYC